MSAKKIRLPSKPMPNGFLTLEQGVKEILAVKTDDGLFDVAKVAAATGRKLPADILELIARDASDLVRRAVRKYASGRPNRARLDERKVKFKACVPRPEKIIAVGMNYRDHAAEINMPIPDFPLLFNKFNNALLGHKNVLRLPKADTKQFDYEVELVVVIGKTARNVSERAALSHVFGYCVGNDFSARDLQVRTSQVMLGKVPDGFAPIGPVLVPASDVPDPNVLDVECVVNGERRQFSNTDQMIFPCAFLVSYLSRYMTLRPGDVIFTGTPGGPILGMPKKKQRWLKKGDEVITRIAALGEQRFTLG